MKKVFFLLAICLIQIKAVSQVINFDNKGRQLVKFDELGNAVDAHDGEIACFNGTYYLYGTSYDCGFAWQDETAPFCGFKVYESKDLRNWVDKGFLFDAKTAIWQSRCDGKTYGCFRPHVVYNQKTKLYVLWINVYDNCSGYRVFTSAAATGPFLEVAEPKLAVNADMPAGGLNNGDHDTFVDDDGKAYLAYTDWRRNGAIVIEQLSDDYLTGIGKCFRDVTDKRTEAPCLFKRNGLYYVIYSDPNCGYCGGTGSSYKTAKSLLGPWSEPIEISNNSCGGQPSFVSAMRINGKTMYLYGSDLWNNGAKNEALANYYWAPLEFAENGAIKHLKCAETYLLKKNSSLAAFSQDMLGANGYNIRDDINNDRHYSQSFTVKRSGKLKDISVTLFKNKYPNADLIFELYSTTEDGLPTGTPIFCRALNPKQLGWSPRNVVVHSNVKVDKGRTYAFVLSTKATEGNYGCVTKESTTSEERLALRTGEQQSFMLLPQSTIKFEIHIAR